MIVGGLAASGDRGNFHHRPGAGVGFGEIAQGEAWLSALAGGPPPGHAVTIAPAGLGTVPGPSSLSDGTLQ